MRTSNIRLKVELDDDNLCEKIFWGADDAPFEGLEESKAASVAVWDPLQRDTLKIDLWAKDMPVDEMKHFMLDILQGVGNTLKNATGDDYMHAEITELAKKLFARLQEERAGEQDGSQPQPPQQGGNAPVPGMPPIGKKQ